MQESSQLLFGFFCRHFQNPSIIEWFLSRYFVLSGNLMKKGVFLDIMNINLTGYYFNMALLFRGSSLFCFPVQTLGGLDCDTHEGGYSFFSAIGAFKILQSNYENIERVAIPVGDGVHFALYVYEVSTIRLYYFSNKSEKPIHKFQINKFLRHLTGESFGI